ncbi:MAG: BON domain-containing protein [Legionellales bacterium]|nr:BON domain-containing protein [Legionellales bacterium]
MNTTMVKYCIAVIWAINLCACSTVFTAANSVYHRNSLLDSIKTIHINHRINVLIYQHPALHRANVNATTFDHDVLLTGQVPTLQLKQEAQQLAQHVSGVSEVINYLRIAPNVDNATEVHDNWLTTKIKTQIIANDTLHPDQIKIISENGEVFLFGIMTREEADIALRIAKNTQGVKKVIPVFRYIRVDRAYDESHS